MRVSSIAIRRKPQPSNAMIYVVSIILFIFLDIVMLKVLELSTAGSMEASQPFRSHITNNTSWLKEECAKMNGYPSIVRKGNYYVFYDVFSREMKVDCSSTITFATQGDFRFLFNLEETCQRWDGPISVAVYAPGSDLMASIQTILYLRECRHTNIKQKVSFHIYLNIQHMPLGLHDKIQKASRITESEVKEICSSGPPWQKIERTYRSARKLKYPVNVARNVAREASPTYYILTADIEMFPSLHLIKEFMPLVTSIRPPPTAVFVLPEFEVIHGIGIPERKPELVMRYNQLQAVGYHNWICKPCHEIPSMSAWLRSSPFDEEEEIFAMAKREGRHALWEPVFIHARNDHPWFNEELSWDGLKDKMVLAYQMCLEKYDFSILTNAFLVHTPGYNINKTSYLSPTRREIAIQQAGLVDGTILPELRRIFHPLPECDVEKETVPVGSKRLKELGIDSDQLMKAQVFL